jgi:hypothetical protein
MSCVFHLTRARMGTWMWQFTGSRDEASGFDVVSRHSQIGSSSLLFAHILPYAYIYQKYICCGCFICRDREWEETRGCVGSVPSRSRAHCVRDEERVSHTPHQMACRFAHILPIEHIYQNNNYFVRVSLNASANGNMDVAGLSFSRFASMQARQNVTGTGTGTGAGGFRRWCWLTVLYSDNRMT